MKRLLERTDCRCRATAATKTGRWEKMSGLSSAILSEGARGSRSESTAGAYNASRKRDEQERVMQRSDIRFGRPQPAVSH
jgi:hypothetical protein